MNIITVNDIKCTFVYKTYNSSTHKNILIDNTCVLKKNKRSSNIQVNGVIETFQELDFLNVPVKNLADKDNVSDIIYLDKLFCPVDFVNFFMIYCVNIRLMKEKDLLEMKEISGKLVSNEGTEKDFMKLRDLTLDISSKDVEKIVKDIVWDLTENYYNIFLEHMRENICRTATCRRIYRG